MTKPSHVYIAKTKRSIELCQSLCNKIVLSINNNKSCLIYLKNGVLLPYELALDSGVIQAIGENDRIRYLGCSISN